MILITFRSNLFVDGAVSIPMPEHCIPNVDEWVVFDEMDISDFFIDKDKIFTHWHVFSKEIVFNRKDHYPTIVCWISANTKSNNLYFTN